MNKKLKFFLRQKAYSWFFQQIICTFLAGYMWLVYLTSSKKFINAKSLLDSAQTNQPLIVVFWHNRLMMVPFVARFVQKQYPKYRFMTLASKHGDGQFVGKVMEKFGLISILGSTKSTKNAARGISFQSLKQIFEGLKKGYSLGVTPDGPRGPNQKINGEIVNIARISGAKILAISYSSKHFIELKTWDKFKIPLPFSKLCFYLDEEAIFVPKKSDKNEEESIKMAVERKMDYIQEKSFQTSKFI